MIATNPSRPVALTIAGFDPGSGAGITADLKTFSAHGIYGVACISAMTVQSTLGVRAVEPLSPRLVRQTLECLAEDVSLSGVKIGMLGNSAVVREVSSFLICPVPRDPTGADRSRSRPAFQFRNSAHRSGWSGRPPPGAAPSSRLDHAQRRRIGLACRRRSVSPRDRRPGTGADGCRSSARDGGAAGQR